MSLILVLGSLDHRLISFDPICGKHGAACAACAVTAQSQRNVAVYGSWQSHCALSTLFCRSGLTSASLSCDHSPRSNNLQRLRPPSCPLKTGKGYHIGLAASIAPIPLKAPELVMTTSTGYIQVMYFAQPDSCISFPPECAIKQSRKHTPICHLPAKVFTNIRYKDHCEQQFYLLQTLSPFSICV